MENKKIFNILSYIGPLFLIALFVPEKDDKSVKLHCGQGMLLFIIELVLGIVIGIITGVLVFVAPFVAALIGGIFGTVIGLASLAFAIIGIINAATEKDVELPIIGSFAFYR